MRLLPWRQPSLVYSPVPLNSSPFRVNVSHGSRDSRVLRGPAVAAAVAGFRGFSGIRCGFLGRWCWDRAGGRSMSEPLLIEHEP